LHSGQPTQIAAGSNSFPNSHRNVIDAMKRRERYTFDRKKISFGNEVRIDQMQTKKFMRAPTSAHVRKHLNRM
jgi:hypothetical protein